MEIVELATEQLQMKMEVLCQIAELDAASAADRASWDDSPEGERLRRYEITCSRTWLRLFDLLLKARHAGEELDFATIASVERSVPARNNREIAKSALPLPTASPQPRNPPKTLIRRSQPNRVAKICRTNPILVFIISYKR